MTHRPLPVVVRVRACGPPLGAHVYDNAPEGSQIPEGGWMSRPVRRVLSLRAVTGTAEVATIHLRRPLPVASSGLPVRSGGQPSDTHCLAVLRVGLTEPRQSPGVLVVSYTTVSPLPTADGGRSAFCGTVPRVTPGGR